MRLDIVSSKPYPRVIPRFFAHLIKDSALNDLYGKMLDTFGFKFATMKRWDLLRKYVFQRHFDSDDLRKVIFAPLISCCVPGRTVSRESNIHGGTFHNAEQFSIVVSFTAFYSMIKIYKMYSPVTCLRHTQIRVMTVGHVSFPWTCIALHSVL